MNCDRHPAINQMSRDNYLEVATPIHVAIRKEIHENHWKVMITKTFIIRH